MKVRKSRRVDMMEGIEHYVDVMDVETSSDEMDIHHFCSSTANTRGRKTIGKGAPLTKENVAKLSGEAGGSSRLDYQDTRTASLDSQMTSNPQKVKDERARRQARNAANGGRA
ncbi:hypothetical protein BSKO_06898 [Bryopsis sp. KO-2023]|nr:hypothetical protein BSKO_06898 [Bryopsis sp. KO-2023]